MPEKWIRKIIVYMQHARRWRDSGRTGLGSSYAAGKKLDNLVVIVDNNNLQIDGTIEEVNSPYPIDKKFEAFNFHVINIDGHDFDQIELHSKKQKKQKESQQLSLQRL